MYCVQVLLILLILLAHSLLLLVAGFGIAHLYFATSMDHGHLTLNQALHVYQHNYTDSLWFLGRCVTSLPAAMCHMCICASSCLLCTWSSNIF